MLKLSAESFLRSNLGVSDLADDCLKELEPDDGPLRNGLSDEDFLDFLKGLSSDFLEKVLSPRFGSGADALRPREGPEVLRLGIRFG